MFHYDGSWSFDRMLAPKVMALWGSSGTDIFAVAQSYTCHYDGIEWMQFGQIAGFGLSAGLWGTGPDNVYAVGNDAHIFHYNGSSWSLEENPLTSTNGILHIGEYDGIALAGTAYSVWAGNASIGDEILGRQTMFDGFDVTVVAAPEIIRLSDDVPTILSLTPCTPNPFASRTSFSYSLPMAGPVRLALYNVAGRRVATLMDRVQDAGRYRVTWDARSSKGLPLSSGVYLLRLETHEETSVQRLVIRR